MSRRENEMIHDAADETVPSCLQCPYAFPEHKIKRDDFVCCTRPCGCVATVDQLGVLMRTLELSEQGVKLFPVVWRHGELAVLAGLAVLSCMSVKGLSDECLSLLTSSKSSNLSRQFSQ